MERSAWMTFDCTYLFPVGWWGWLPLRGCSATCRWRWSHLSWSYFDRCRVISSPRLGVDHSPLPLGCCCPMQSVARRSRGDGWLFCSQGNCLPCPTPSWKWLWHPAPTILSHLCCTCAYPELLQTLLRLWATQGPSQMSQPLQWLQLGHSPLSTGDRFGGRFCQDCGMNEDITPTPTGV